MCAILHYLDSFGTSPRLDLAMAMEDHDLYRIKRFLPVAQNLGVAPQEMDT